MGYEIVLWVDSNASLIENVKKPCAILDIEYDVILISVSRSEYVESIKQSLRDIGIGDEKLMWKKPVRAM